MRVRGCVCRSTSSKQRQPVVAMPEVRFGRASDWLGEVMWVLRLRCCARELAERQWVDDETETNCTSHHTGLANSTRWRPSMHSARGSRS